jgi:hypothetical protein
MMLVNKIEAIVLKSTDNISRPTEPTVLLLPLIFMILGSLQSYAFSMVSLLAGIVLSIFISRPFMPLNRLYESKTSRTRTAFLHYIVKYMDQSFLEAVDDDELLQIIVASARCFDWQE